MLSLVEQLKDGKMIFLYRGKSMFPRFIEGDLLHIEPYHDRPIRIGEIVVFSKSDSEKLIVHRVVQKNHSSIKTCGDNNYAADEGLVGIEDIIGGVKSVLRNGHMITVGFGIFARFYILTLIFRKLRRRFLRKAKKMLSVRNYNGVKIF